jgi:hypothetical protein
MIKLELHMNYKRPHNTKKQNKDRDGKNTTLVFSKQQEQCSILISVPNTLNE